MHKNPDFLLLIRGNLQQMFSASLKRLWRSQVVQKHRVCSLQSADWHLQTGLIWFRFSAGKDREEMPSANTDERKEQSD